MSDIIVEYIKQGVNLFLNGLTLTMIIGTFLLVSVFATAINSQEATNQKLAEAAEYSQYVNGTTMLGSDVVAVIMKYKDTIGVVVRSGGNVVVSTIGTYDAEVYDSNSNKIAGPGNVGGSVLGDDDYNLTYLIDIISPSNQYTPSVGYSKNGEISCIFFDKLS